MKFLTLLLCVCLTSAVHAQVDTVFVHKTGESGIEIDTLYYPQGVAEPPVLVGTMLLPGAVLSHSLYSVNVNPVSLTRGPGCSQNEPSSRQLEPGFQVLERDAGRLSIETTFAANCCYEFLGQAYAEGDTLVLKPTGYGMFCGCTCCHNVVWEFYEWTTEDEPNLMLRYVRLEDHPNWVVRLPENVKGG